MSIEPKLENSLKNDIYKLSCKLKKSNSEIIFQKSKEEIYEDFIQTTTPLNLFSDLLKNDFKIEDEKKKNLLSKLEKAIENLTLKINAYFKPPKLIRYIKKIDILHIEDNTLTTDALRMFFEGKKYSYKAIENAQNALDFLKGCTPKLILLDINLPGIMKGDKLCQILKNSKEFREIPIILLTAKISAINKEQYLSETKADKIIFKDKIENISDLSQILKFLNK